MYFSHSFYKIIIIFLLWMYYIVRGSAVISFMLLQIVGISRLVILL